MTPTRPQIVHVSSAHPWTDNRVHLREAAGAAAAGWRVRLIAVESDVGAEPTGVDVVTIRRRGRAARMLLSSAQAVGLAVRSGAPVCHLHDPELAWSISLLRALGRRVVFDAHEDLPDQVISKAYLPPRLVPAARLVARAVVRVVSGADRVVAATETIARAYPADRTVLVRNYPRLRDEEQIAAPTSERAPVVVYVGALNDARGAPLLSALVRSPEFPAGWRLDVAGGVSGTSAADLGQLERADSVPVRFLGRIDPEAARDLVLSARVGLVVFQPTAAHLASLPTKLFEYMAAGLPVVLSDFPLWRRLVGHLDCATFVDPDDPHAVARAIAAYAADPALADRHGAAGRRAALDLFSWESEEATLVELYRGLLGSPGASA